MGRWGNSMSKSRVRRGCMIFVILAFGFAFFSLIPFPAEAESFQCDSAKSDFQKLVCADPKLVELNKKVEKAFLEASAVVPEDGRYDLNESQSRWRRYAADLCRSIPGKKGRAVKDNCLGAFTGRIRLLEEPQVFVVGGIKFREVVWYGTVPSDDPYRNVGTIWKSYLQIVNPSDIGQRVLNRYLYSRARDLPHLTFDGKIPTDEDYSYSQTIDFVSPGMISIVEGTWFYGHGAPHGYPGTGRVAWLVDEMRPLSFYDVFKKGVDAEYRLLSLIYKREYDDFAGEEEEQSRKEIREMLGSKGGMHKMVEEHQLSKWSVLKEGLLLTYEHGGIMSVKGNYFPCYFLSWDDLKDIVDLDAISRLTAGDYVYAKSDSVRSSECFPEQQKP